MGSLGHGFNFRRGLRFFSFSHAHVMLIITSITELKLHHHYFINHTVCCLSLTGTLIRRHRIPLPPPNDEEFYTVENFNVGQEITLYSRTFKITVSILVNAPKGM